MCIQHALKTLRSELAHACTASGGTFCNMGPRFGTLWELSQQRETASEPDPWALIRVTLVSGSVLGYFKQLS